MLNTSPQGVVCYLPYSINRWQFTTNHIYYVISNRVFVEWYQIKHIHIQFPVKHKHAGNICFSWKNLPNELRVIWKYDKYKKYYFRIVTLQDNLIDRAVVCSSSACSITQRMTKRKSSNVVQTEKRWFHIQNEELISCFGYVECYNKILY